MKLEYVVTDGPGTMLALGVADELSGEVGADSTIKFFIQSGEWWEAARTVTFPHTARIQYEACPDDCQTGR